MVSRVGVVSASFVVLLVAGTLPGQAPQNSTRGEPFFKSVKPLTDGCVDAEAYFSWDNTRVVFQRTCPELNIHCDQIFWFSLAEPSRLHRVSPGGGRTTCSFFVPGDSLIVFASTHAYTDTCPPKFDYRKFGKYVWQLLPQYEIFVANVRTGKIKQITRNDVYDAEVVAGPTGSRLLFTSMRTGDPELFLMNIDGTGVKQITDMPGYDGGAFFSPSGRWIVFRRTRFDSREDSLEYFSLLKRNLVAPSKMEIFIIDTNGNNLRQITNLGGANWAPYFHPSEKYIIFSSNWEAKAAGRYFPFHLYIIPVEGGKPLRVTDEGIFNAFPMFSHDGRSLLFSSTRGTPGMRPIRIFLAEWDEEAFQEALRREHSGN